MNSAIAVGLSGPAPSATATSPPADAGTGETAPFAQVLQGAGPSRSPSVGTGGEPPGSEPGSLDVASLLQLLLEGTAPVGDQTTTGPDQLDRPAGAGTTETEVTADPVAGEMLVALMPQLAIPVTDPEVGSPQLAASLAGATADPTVGRGIPQPTGIEVLVPSGDGAAVATPRSADVAGPPPTLPNAAVDMQPTTVGTVAVGVEQQNAVPLAQASAAGTAVVESSDVAEVEIVEEPVTVTLDPSASDASADESTEQPTTSSVDELAVNQPSQPAVRNEASSVSPRDTAAPPNVDGGDAAVVQATQPATSTSRSSSPVSATEPAAAAAPTEVFTADLANTVRRASMLGDQEVRLLLNPPELGHLDVRIVESPQGLRVVLEATTAEARELIERQLPALRSALESRDLKVERLQVEQASDVGAADERSERGLRQDTPGNGQSDQPGDSGTPWSPVAGLQSDGNGEPVAAGATSGSTSARTAASDGRLDLLA